MHNLTRVPTGQPNLYRRGNAAQQAKPRLSIGELAKKNARCRERKAAGLPCTEFNPPAMQTPNPLKPIRWAYGVTTVPERRDTLLTQTLESLRLAGFDRPHLFVDGERDGAWYRALWPESEVTTRYPVLRTYGNWALGLAELYIRNPTAQRFAMFQDDFVTYRNLRAYLDHCPLPEKGYWNLYTFPSNQRETRGWYEAALLGSDTTFQTGRGAVALVFGVEAVKDLLSHRHMVDRVQDAHSGHRRIDGGIVTAMNQAGYRELVHNPSLVQHTGDVSSMGNRPHLKAVSFRGEGYDALELLAWASETR